MAEKRYSKTTLPKKKKKEVNKGYRTEGSPHSASILVNVIKYFMKKDDKKKKEK